METYQQEGGWNERYQVCRTGGHDDGLYLEGLEEGEFKMWPQSSGLSSWWRAVLFSAQICWGGWCVRRISDTGDSLGGSKCQHSEN